MIVLSYVSGYGWHMPRFVWWSVIVLGGLIGGALAGAVDVTLRFATGLEHAPFSFVVPAVIALLAHRRVQRIRDRGVIVVDRLTAMSSLRVDMVRADLEPDRFAWWLAFEQVMLTTIVIAWSVTPVALLFAR